MVEGLQRNICISDDVSIQEGSVRILSCSRAVFPISGHGVPPRAALCSAARSRHPPGQRYPP